MQTDAVASRRFLALRPGHLDQPHPSRLAPHHPRCDEILTRHAEAMAEGRTSYRDPSTGYSVFTAAFLADRGYCCDSGCRHCPYIGAEPGSGA